MADQFLKSIQKRTIQSEQKPVKRQKHEKCEESINVEADPDVAAPITNICNELLDRIMDLLDLESLLNVADTCTRLQIAAAAKFGQKFDQHFMFITNSSSSDTIANCVLEMNCSLPLLRCFGGKISRVSVLSNGANEFDEYLLRYIDQYCGDALTMLEYSCRVFSMSFSKPMKNVTKLKIVDCDLGEQLPNFVKWFPNLRDLEFRLYANDFNEMLAVSFPHLESLSLKLQTSGHLNSKCVKNLLHANPQLKNLCIALPYKKSFDELLSMLSENPSLLKLELWGHIKDVDAVALNQFSKNHPLLEELVLSVLEFSVEDAVLLSRELIHLKSLSFQFDDPAKRDQLLIHLDSRWQHNSSNKFSFEHRYSYHIVLNH